MNRGFFENSNNRTTLISTCPERGDYKFRTRSPNPLVTQSSAKCGYQMRCLKNRRTSDLGPRREPSSASSPSRDPKLPRRDSGLLPLCPAAAAAAVAPASAKQKNGWRCSSRSVHEWCEDLHYWKLLSIIEQIIFVLIQLPSSYYSFWRAHE